MALSLRNSYFDSTSVVTNVDVVVGDLVIVAHRNDYQIARTCSDNAFGGSNIYNEVGAGFSSTTYSSDVHIFYCIAKASEVLIVNIAGDGAYAGTFIHVVSGALQDLNSVLDTYAGEVNGFGTTLSSASITTSNANDYLFTFWSQDVTNNLAIEDNGTGFILRQEFLNYNYSGPSASFDKIVSAIGTYSQSANLKVSGTPTAAGEVRVIVAFKSADIGGSGTDKSLSHHGPFQFTKFDPTPITDSSLLLNNKSAKITIDTGYTNHVSLQFGSRNLAFTGYYVIVSYDPSRMLLLF